MLNQQQIINQYYIADTESAFKRDFFMKTFVQSGYALIDKIHPTESIIDIGCGQNLFKPYFSNLVGIDPATDKSDFRVSLQEYSTDQKFDVALCLGSIQGTDDELYKQLDIIKKLLKPQGRIYWRCMPDPAPTPVPAWMQLWTFDKHYVLAERYGFVVKEIAWDQRNPSADYTPRIYAEWIQS